MPLHCERSMESFQAFIYVQRWLPGLAEVYKLLYCAQADKLHGMLVWPEMIADIERVKQIITDYVTLSLPYMDKHFTVVTDYCYITAGAMLARESDKLTGYSKTVAFYHLTLETSEQKCSVTEKFRVYFGGHFDFITYQ